MALPVNRPFDEIVLSGRVADVAATTPGFVVAPCKGKIKRAYSVVEGTTNGTAVISFAIAGATALTDTLTIANGATAGEMDSVDFSQTNSAAGIINEGDNISITSDGGGSTTVVGNFFIVMERT